jgi:hypothetical protein
MENESVKIKLLADRPEFSPTLAEWDLANRLICGESPIDFKIRLARDYPLNSSWSNLICLHGRS